LNGEETAAEGNCHTRDEGFLFVLDKDDDTWAKATFDFNISYTGPPVFSQRRAYDTVRELEGVQEVEREKIGVDQWIFTIDKADRDIETERERTLHLGEFFLEELDGFHLSIYVDRRDIYGKWFVGGQVLENDGMYKHKGNIEKADEYMDDYDRGVKNSIFDY